MGMGLIGFEDEEGQTVAPTLNVSEERVMELELDNDTYGFESDLKELSLALTRYQMNVGFAEELDETVGSIEVAMEDEDGGSVTDKIAHLTYVLGQAGAPAADLVGFEADDKGIVEKAKDMAKKLWAHIANFFKSLWQMIKNMFASVMNFFSGIEAKWKRLEENYGKAKSRYESALSKAQGKDKKKATAIEKDFNDKVIKKVKLPKAYAKDIKGFYADLKDLANSSKFGAEMAEKTEEARLKIMEAYASGMKKASGESDSAAITKALTEMKAELSPLKDALASEVGELSEKAASAKMGLVTTVDKKSGKIKASASKPATEKVEIKLKDIGGVEAAVKGMTDAVKVLKESGKAMKKADANMKKSNKIESDNNKKMSGVAAKLAKNPDTASGSVELGKAASLTTTGVLSVASSTLGAQINSKVNSLIGGVAASTIAAVVNAMNTTSGKLEAVSK